MQLQQEEQARADAPGAGGSASGTAAGTRGNAGAGTGAYPRSPVAGAGAGVGNGTGVGPQSGAVQAQHTGSPARGAPHGSAFSRYQPPHSHQPSSQRSGRDDESVCLKLQIIHILYTNYPYNIVVLRTRGVS